MENSVWYLRCMKAQLEMRGIYAIQIGISTDEDRRVGNRRLAFLN